MRAPLERIGEVSAKSATSFASLDDPGVVIGPRRSQSRLLIERNVIQRAPDTWGISTLMTCELLASKRALSSLHEPTYRWIDVNIDVSKMENDRKTHPHL